jgi:pimeloyl-ACP methyl ester carboxylesterase
MKLTVLLGLVALLAACGGGSNQAASSGTEPSAATTTTAATIPSVEERAQLLAYDASVPLGLVEKKTKRMNGVGVADVAFDAGDRKVSAFLVRPQGKPKAAVLWAHWYGEEANTNRTEFLPDALALARDGVLSLLPQGLFPWEEDVSEDAQVDQDLAVEQIVQLRRGLDVLQDEAGDVALGFVGHDYGAMFGAALVADERPQAYVLMAPDATFSNWFLKYFVRGASKPELDAAFAPLEPVNNVGDALPASVLFQFAKSDRYVPYYVADKLTGAAGDSAQTETYESGHELDEKARKDRLAWLRAELGLS